MTAGTRRAVAVGTECVATAPRIFVESRFLGDTQVSGRRQGRQLYLPWGQLLAFLPKDRF